IWLKGSLVLGAGIGFLVFYGVPKIRGKIPQGGSKGSEAAICGIFLGVLVFLFVPAVYKWILPPPANWFPQDIVDISETRKLEALERIERVAASYSEDEAE
ncbi:MAG: hypothetical protein QNL24_16275, partial [Akkermansiaceae bacterium]